MTEVKNSGASIKNSNITIRDLKFSDISASESNQILNIKNYAFFKGEERPWDSETILSFKRLQTLHLLLISRKKLDGFALLNVVADSAELISFAIHPDSESQGMGRFLLKACLKKAEALNANTIFLEVRSNNERALALYKSCGFSLNRVRRAYYKLTDGSTVDGQELSYKIIQKQIK